MILYIYSSTSISNVAGASLSRRSSERELADSGAKKRTSSSTDRQDGELVEVVTAHQNNFRSNCHRHTHAHNHTHTLHGVQFSNNT